jgi:hypothetical protein
VQQIGADDPGWTLTASTPVPRSRRASQQVYVVIASFERA